MAHVLGVMALLVGIYMGGLILAIEVQYVNEYISLGQLLLLVVSYGMTPIAIGVLFIVSAVRLKKGKGRAGLVTMAATTVVLALTGLAEGVVSPPPMPGLVVAALTLLAISATIIVLVVAPVVS